VEKVGAHTASGVILDNRSLSVQPRGSFSWSACVLVCLLLQRTRPSKRHLH
jgi:hypothetical protein